MNNRMEKVVRWTIGPTTKSGLECLGMSIESYLKWHGKHNAKIVICHNCPAENLATLFSEFPVTLHNQSRYLVSEIKPKGVAWKLYPPRLAPNSHELQIDNDIVFKDRIEEIDVFFKNDITLLLGAASRNYGQFDNHVPPKFCINSGIFGMPPGFNLQKYIDFHVNTQWEENATGKHAASKTFDEQGLVAFALLSYRDFVIIPDTSVTNCENNLVEGKGLHFIGLNRDEFHVPFRLYRSSIKKMYL